jgi:hypothetical protein
MNTNACAPRTKDQAILRHMRVIVGVHSLFLALSSCFGQTTGTSKAVTYGDVTVTTGMSRANVLLLFDASSTVTLNKVSESSYGVYKKDLVYVTQPVGSIHFERDLVKALGVDEEPAKGSEAATLFDSIYVSIEKLQSKQCTVRTFIDPNPGPPRGVTAKLLKVIFSCGAETMQIMSLTLTDRNSTIKTVRVNRIIE